VIWTERLRRVGDFIVGNQLLPPGMLYIEFSCFVKVERSSNASSNRFVRCITRIAECKWVNGTARKAVGNGSPYYRFILSQGFGDCPLFFGYRRGKHGTGTCTEEKVYV